MIFMVSGEGPTDIGVCINGQGDCTGVDFQAGPMAVIIDKLVERIAGYSLLESQAMECVPRTALARITKELPKNSLTGKKRGYGTASFFKSAFALASIAKSKSDQADCPTAAVLFHDADGTRSTEDGLYETKWEAIETGFRAHGFETGVPMVPKPKSEAWLICALKPASYQHCGHLEDAISGNDNAPNSAKSQLATLIPAADNTAVGLADKVSDNTIDAARIDMPSYNRFRERLEHVTRKMLGLPQPA
jgi:hypothetical protein